MPKQITFLDMLRAWKQIEPSEELRECIAQGLPGARHVMSLVYVLLGYWNRRTQLAWPSLGKLRRRYTWSKNTMHKALVIAENLGLIRVHVRSGQTNAYSFPAIEELARAMSGVRVKRALASDPTPVRSPDQVAQDRERSQKDYEELKRELGVNRLVDLIGQSGCGLPTPDVDDLDLNGGEIVDEFYREDEATDGESHLQDDESQDDEQAEGSS